MKKQPLDFLKMYLPSTIMIFQPAIIIFWSVACDVFSDAVPFASFKHLKTTEGWSWNWSTLSCQGVQWKTAPCFSFSVSVLPVWFNGSSRIWHVFEVDWSRILSGILGRWKPNFRRSKLEEHVWDLYGIYDQQFDVFRSFCLLLVGGSVSFNSTWSKNHLHRCAETLFGAPRASPLECCSYCMAWSEHQKGWVWLTLHLEVVAKTCSQVVLWEKFMTWWGKFSQTWVSTSLPWFSLVSSPTRPAIFCLRLFVGGEVRLPQQ